MQRDNLKGRSLLRLYLGEGPPGMGSRLEENGTEGGAQVRELEQRQEGHDRAHGRAVLVAGSLEELL